jgi:uncharacterized protein (UPF0254 family)
VTVQCDEAPVVGDAVGELDAVGVATGVGVAIGVGVAAGLGGGPSLIDTGEPRGITWMNVWPTVRVTALPFLS